MARNFSLLPLLQPSLGIVTRSTVRRIGIMVILVMDMTIAVAMKRPPPKTKANCRCKMACGTSMYIARLCLSSVCVAMSISMTLLRSFCTQLRCW